jgi:glucosylglycerate phosphorylase
MDRRSMILDDLVYLYGEERAQAANEQLWGLIDAFRQAHPGLAKAKNQPRMDQRDAILITYGDMVNREDVHPLAVLNEFARKKLKGLVNTIHILPFFPYSSDDGFSVIDFKEVNPEWGG